jgi:hypothetical protein
MTSASLLASSTRLPARTADKVGSNPAAPTMAAMTIRTLPAAAASASARSPHSTRVDEPQSRRARCAFAAA